MSLEERLRAASSELEKKLLIVGELTRRLSAEGIQPIIVGGTAVEIYSSGDYQSHDVDLVVPQRERAVRELQVMGFEPMGRLFYHPHWEVVLEIPDVALAGDSGRVNTIEIDGYQVHCIGLEDLIIDRLNAAVHWGSREDRRWAETLLRAYRGELDMTYLRQRAQQEEVLTALEELWQVVQSDGDLPLG